MRAKYACAGNIILLVDNLADVEVRDIYDQAISLEHSPGANRFDVQIVNKDGSKADNCLNGIMAAMRHAVDQLGVTAETGFYQNEVYLASGIFHAGKWPDVEVYVPFPGFVQGPDVYASVQEIKSRPDIVTLGNSHQVYWLDRFYRSGRGGFQEVFPKKNYIPEGADEEYVCTVNGDQAFVNVFESGVGETVSCGSGAVAVGFAAFKRNIGRQRFRWAIQTRGGALYVRVAEPEQRVYLSGQTNRID